MISSTYYIYMLPAILIMGLAQWYVTSSYGKWSRVANQRGLTGAEAVQRLIRAGGLHDIKVQQIGGNLTDHYDPRNRVLRLSPGVAQNASVASLAIAAHELGHAMQDRDGYFLLRLRAAMVPMVNIGSTLGWILIFAGLIFNFIGISWLGLAFFSGSFFFALATLPVELNASARARQLLADAGMIVDDRERSGISRVLNAAAMTYVAALFAAVIQLMYYASMVSGRRRR